MSVGWLLIALSKNTSLVWGGMTASGLVIGGASIGSIWLLTHWQYANLFFRVLPPALFSLLLIYEMIRMRSLYRNRYALLETGVDESKEIAADLLAIEPVVT